MSSRPLTAKQRKLTNTLAPVANTGITMEPATVNSPTTTITFRGVSVPYKRIAGYTPFAGDLVAVLKNGSQLLVIGKIV
jgi:hypothetical protein